MKTVWRIYPPANGEKVFGKHPTQKPVALVKRCLLASTNEGDLVLDPFMGSGTTAVAAITLSRKCVGLEKEDPFLGLAHRRADSVVVAIWLKTFRVAFHVSVFPGNDLDLFMTMIHRSRSMEKEPELQGERIFHECKFVFLSCAMVDHTSVVHTTIQATLQEAWSDAPQPTKRATTHIVRCETEILRVKPH